MRREALASPFNDPGIDERTVQKFFSLWKHAEAKLPVDKTLRITTKNPCLLLPQNPAIQGR